MTWGLHCSIIFGILVHKCCIWSYIANKAHSSFISYARTDWWQCGTSIGWQSSEILPLNTILSLFHEILPNSITGVSCSILIEVSTIDSLSFWQFHGLVMPSFISRGCLRSCWFTHDMSSLWSTIHSIDVLILLTHAHF